MFRIIIAIDAGTFRTAVDALSEALAVELEASRPTAGALIREFHGLELSRRF